MDDFLARLFGLNRPSGSLMQPDSPLFSMQGDPDIVNTMGAPQSPMSAVGMAGQGAPSDSWHPHHTHFLGRLADAYLQSQGMAPAFANAKGERNMAEALQGFGSDPMQAVQRLSQIPGHEKDAMALYDKVQDNQRLDGNLDRQNNLYDLKLEDFVRGRVAGMLSSVKPGDKASYARAREMAIKYGQSKNFDFSGELPEDGDTFDSDTFRYGEVPVAKQLQLDETANNHDVLHEDRVRGQDLSHGDRVRGQNMTHGDRVRGQDLSHGDRVTAEGGRNTRSNNRPSAQTSQTVMTKYGPGIIGKSGNTLQVMRGGKKYGYIKTGTANGKSNWTPIGEIPK